MKKIRDPGSPRVGGFWPWESLLSRILSGSRLEPWLEPLTLPAGAPWIFLIFFIVLIFFDFFRKTKKIKKNQFFFDFFDFFRKGQKNQKNQTNQKNPGPWVSPRGGFLAVGIPPLPDPEWLQAGAPDSPCGDTLVFLFFLIFFEKPKKIKKSFFVFFDFFRKGKKIEKNQTKTKKSKT